MEIIRRQTHPLCFNSLQTLFRRLTETVVSLPCIFYFISPLFNQEKNPLRLKISFPRKTWQDLFLKTASWHLSCLWHKNVVKPVTQSHDLLWLDAALLLADSVNEPEHTWGMLDGWVSVRHSAQISLRVDPKLVSTSKRRRKSSTGLKKEKKKGLQDKKKKKKKCLQD